MPVHRSIEEWDGASMWDTEVHGIPLIFICFVPMTD